MSKNAERDAGKVTAGLRRVSKRARTFLVICVGALLVGFVALPLWINGYLFVADPPAEVYAAERQPSPTPAAPTPTPKPTPALIVVADAPSPTPDTSAYHTLSPEDEDEAVAALQARLMELGYFDYDETTHYYGSVTKSAVQLVQRVLGAEQTGVADPAFQALLFSEDVPAYCMRQGDKGSDVRGMQARLAELGYYEGKVNGYFGVATQRAVVKFQARNKLEETGEVDGAARSLLYSPNARPLADPTPTPTIKPSPSPTPKATATPRPSYNIPELDEDEMEETAPTPKPTRTPVRWEDFLDEDENEEEDDEPEEREEETASYGSGVSGLIAAAKAQLGRPYVWSQESPEDGFDCSGLVYYCLRQTGVSVGRWTALNYSQNSAWKAIDSLADCKKGDLLFYKSDADPNVNHTGIYLGGGQFIHASSTQGKVVISDTTGYYQRNFVVARRVF